MSITEFAVLRSPFEYGPYETNPYADQMEREFHRVGLGRLYDTIVANADVSEHPTVLELQDKVDELQEQLKQAEETIEDLRVEIEVLQGKISDVLYLLAELEMPKSVRDAIYDVL